MFVFFDIDDTLFDHRHANREQARALWVRNRGLFPWDEEAFLALWHELLEHHFDRHARGELTHCVYVGDKLAVDARGACSAGWRGIWLDRSAEDQSCEGVERIRSLSELPDLLRRTS